MPDEIVKNLSQSKYDVLTLEQSFAENRFPVGNTSWEALKTK